MLRGGIEPPTSPLPMECSTTELPQRTRRARANAKRAAERGAFAIGGADRQGGLRGLRGLATGQAMTSRENPPLAPPLAALIAPPAAAPKRGEANAAARRERQAAALRENLKKRKSQSRERRAPDPGD